MHIQRNHSVFPESTGPSEAGLYTQRRRQGKGKPSTRIKLQRATAGGSPKHTQVMEKRGPRVLHLDEGDGGEHVPGEGP